MNRLPYVQEYRDRHGRLRRYFRRPGSRRIPLPGRPGSQEFMTAYNTAQAGYVVREIGTAGKATRHRVPLVPRSLPTTPTTRVYWRTRDRMSWTPKMRQVAKVEPCP